MARSSRIVFKRRQTSKTLQILLNLIENTQKEIEYWKDKFDKELDDNIEKTTKIMKKDNRINELEKALEKKDKTILKMAKAINSYDIDKDICKQMGQRKHCSDYDEEYECEKCIIEYFEKKEG